MGWSKTRYKAQREPNLDDTIRKIMIVTGALFMLMMICGGLVFLLAGDRIIDGTRDVIMRIQLEGRRAELDTPLSADDSVLRFTVQPGSTAREIGSRLQTLGIIADGDLFTLYVRVEGLDTDLEAGTFFIQRNMTTRQIAGALTDASFSQIEFTVFPGQRVEEIAERIDNMTPYFAFSGADFLAQVGNGAPIPSAFAAQNDIPFGGSLEGFLFPDTYIFEPEVTAVGMRDVLLAAFTNAVADLRPLVTQTPYNMYEIVTLASIIEREAVFDDEKPLISSVYRNRLEGDNDINTLDADPTVQYEHPNATPGNWWPRITVADYRGVISPYNTYINRGLPPAPIASPALSSIRAAIQPEESPYLFFRADCRGDNRHDFFTNYTDHVNAC